MAVNRKMRFRVLFGVDWPVVVFLAAIMALAAVVVWLAGNMVEPEARGGGVTADTLLTGGSVSLTPTPLAQVNVENFDALTMWVDYAPGDEDALTLTTYWRHTYDGDRFQEENWSTTNGARSLQGGISYSLTTTGTAYISYDVSGIPFFQVDVAGTGTITSAGTVTVTYSAD